MFADCIQEMNSEPHPETPDPESAGSQTPPVLGSARGTCIYHPNLAAVYVCRHCGGAVCSLCAVPQEGGLRLCTNCASAVPGATRAPVNISGMKCVQHRSVAAVRACKLCAAPMCATCDFLLPGSLHICPKCVISPPSRLSGGRKALVIASYVMGAWTLFGIFLLLNGALFRSGMDRTTAGLLIVALILYPAILGNAFGMSAVERRLPNPGVVWGAAILNGLILTILVILMIAGNLRQMS